AVGGAHSVARRLRERDGNRRRTGREPDQHRRTAPWGDSRWVAYSPAPASRTPARSSWVVSWTSELVGVGDQSRRPKAARIWPEIAVTYCLPSTAYVIGPEDIWPPRFAFHSSLPVRASSAWKYPSRPPVNNRSDAVVRMPLSLTSVMSNFHFCSPVLGSSAMMAPFATASVQLLIGPRRSPGTAGASGAGVN